MIFHEIRRLTVVVCYRPTVDAASVSSCRTIRRSPAGIAMTVVDIIANLKKDLIYYCACTALSAGVGKQSSSACFNFANTLTLWFDTFFDALTKKSSNGKRLKFLPVIKAPKQRCFFRTTVIKFFYHTKKYYRVFGLDETYLC